VEAPPLPPPPLRWQLLAILREDTGYRALVYDPDADRLIVLKEGDESGPQRVERVTATTLNVRGGAGVRTLALREAAAGGRP
jgi:phosphomannomutase